jgi:hypothetical protein
MQGDFYMHPDLLNWPVLASGETVLWRGKPIREKYARIDAKQTLMGIPMAAFIAFWMWFVLKIPRDAGPMRWVFVCFGILFVLQAVYLLIGHYVRNWYEWHNVEYAVTNKRVIVRRGLWASSEISRAYSSEPLELRTSSDGSVGDLIFRTNESRRSKNFAEQIQLMFNPEQRSGEFGLYAVERPVEPYRIIVAQGSGKDEKSPFLR